jgi:hypothetical protein
LFSGFSWADWDFPAHAGVIPTAASATVRRQNLVRAYSGLGVDGKDCICRGLVRLPNTELLVIPS